MSKAPTATRRKRRKLDRTRSFGHVVGPGPTYRYEQDGLVFGPEGKEIMPQEKGHPDVDIEAIEEIKVDAEGNEIVDAPEPEVPEGMEVTDGRGNVTKPAKPRVTESEPIPEIE